MLWSILIPPETKLLRAVPPSRLSYFLTVEHTVNLLMPPTRKHYSTYKCSLNLRDAHIFNATFHSKLFIMSEIVPVSLMGSNLKESLKNQTNHCFLRKLEILLKVILSKVGEEANEESHTMVTDLQFQPALYSD